MSEIDILERLRDDALQLKQMSDHIKLAGPETGVRVKDPSLLLGDLAEAIITIFALRKQVEEWVEEGNKIAPAQETK